MKSSERVLSGPPTPLRPISTRPATADRAEKGAASSAAALAASTKTNATAPLLNNECDSSTPLGDTPTALSLPPPPATHVSDLGDDLLREILAKTGVLDRAVTARMVCRGWRAALAPPKSSASTPTTLHELASKSSPSGPTTGKRGKGLCADVDVTTEPRLLCRLDTDLLLRLLWLSSWGGDPRAADVPSWNSKFPWLRSLKLRGAGWRPTASHRAPSLRRVLAACPRLVKVDATNLKVLVPLATRASGNSSSPTSPSSEDERAAALEAAEDLLFDAGEAQLLAAAALHHGTVKELELDVSVRLSAEDAEEPPERMEEGGGDEEGQGDPRRGVWEKEEDDDDSTTTSMETDFPSSVTTPSLPPPLRLLPTSEIAADPSARTHSAVDVAEAVLAGRTPLRVRRLSLSTPPTTTSSGPTEADGNSSTVSARRCLRLGRAAALGGELRTLTLDRLTPEEAAAAVAGALSSNGKSKNNGNNKEQLRRIELRGVGGGASCCWSPQMEQALALAFSSPTSSQLREIVFEGEAGGATEQERRNVQASVLASANDKVAVLFVDESPARRASGAAYAARAAAAAAAAEARARAQAAEAAVASIPPQAALPATVQV